MSIKEEARYLLEQHEIHPSLPRLVIMEYLIGHRIHPTADEVYLGVCRDYPTLSKTTVYNTLKLFTEKGVLLMLSIDEKNVRFDIDTTSHAHFKCLTCGKIEDIVFERSKLADLWYVNGKEVKEIHLYYRGFCEKCKK